MEYSPLFQGEFTMQRLAVSALFCALACSSATDRSVTLTPRAATLAAKTTTQLTATSAGGVVWDVVETAGGTIDATGLYTAPATDGTFHVIATNAVDRTKTASAALTVVVKPAPVISAPSAVTTGKKLLAAQVAAQVGTTYAWTASGATLTLGAATPAVQFTAGGGSQITLTCVGTNAAGSTTATATLAIEPAGLSVFAGALGGAGALDGTAADARFNRPGASVLAANGTLYVPDSGNHVIRQLATDGTVTTLAGSFGARGLVDGTSAAARFSLPEALALDGSGNLYVSDLGNAAIRKVVLSTGVVTTVAGNGHCAADDGAGAAARFCRPAGLALDASGNLFVVDSSLNTLRKIAPDGTVSTFAGAAAMAGNVDGAGTVARFSAPLGLVYEPASGSLYVGDSGNATVRKVASDGIVSTFAGAGGGFGRVDHLGLDALGNVLVADDGLLALFSITPAGAGFRIDAFGLGAADGHQTGAGFRSVYSVAAEASGSLLVSDRRNGAVRRVTADGTVTTAAGILPQAGFIDGAALDARFGAPGAVAAAADGTTYALDQEGKRLRKIADDGTTSTMTASFTAAQGLTVDPAGTLYVSDPLDNALYTVSPAGDRTFLAGGGDCGTADGAGTLAKFCAPSGLAFASGKLYVADTRNLSIRAVTPGGVVSTVFAGTPASSLGAPLALAVAPSGDLFVLDDTHTLYKLPKAGGTPARFAGNESCGYADGPGAQALFCDASALAVDAQGNLFVTERGNMTVREIAVDGTVSTLAGVHGHGRVEPGALPASLSGPAGIAILPSGDLVVSDANENALLLLRFP